MNHSRNDEQAIARELEALGEAPLSADELALVRGGEDVDLRNVGVLFAVAHPPASASGELEELQRRRVWNVVADRGTPLLHTAPEPTQESSNGSSAWRVVVGAVAVAAGVLLVPRLAPPSDLPSEAELAAQREDLELTGASARAAVESLPGAVGGERARAMADEYAQRLQAQRNGAAQ